MKISRFVGEWNWIKPILFSEKYSWTCSKYVRNKHAQYYRGSLLGYSLWAVKLASSFTVLANLFNGEAVWYRYL